MKAFKLLFAASLSIALGACSPNNVAENVQTLGQETSSIIGGTEVAADHQSIRHIVALYDFDSGALCTGTLLGNNLVLTAAHCIGKDPKKMAIFFGNKVHQNAPRAPVLAVEISPLWESNQFKPYNTGDIALVLFGGPTPEAFQGLPVLPEQYARVLRKGTLVLMLGYGISDGVNKTGSGTLRMVSARVADEKFSATEVVIDQTQGKGACHGDSGGPAIVFVGGQAHVWGVTSRSVGDPDDHCSQYAAYTNATVYLTWIREASARLLKFNSEGRNNPFNGL